MKYVTLPVLLATALLVHSTAGAQESTAANSTNAARDALAKKEGEGDQSALLKETLTAVDKQYSLIRKGKTQYTYDLNYSYIGQEKLVTDYTEGDPVPTKKEWYEPDRGPRPERGYIGLQNHGDEAHVHFKEVSVRPLASAK